MNYNENFSKKEIYADCRNNFNCYINQIILFYIFLYENKMIKKIKEKKIMYNGKNKLLYTMI